MHTSQHPQEAAASRLLALALLADGEFGHADLGLLERLRAFGTLRISRAEFLAAAAEFGVELRRADAAADRRGHVRVDARRIRELLGRIDDGATRLALARLILEVLRADGRIEPGESLLLWEMLDAWNLRLTDLLPRASRACAADAVPRAPRTIRRRVPMLAERSAGGVPAA